MHEFRGQLSKLAILLLASALSGVAEAQLSPASLPFPSPLNLNGIYFNSEDGDTPEEETIEFDYSLTSASGITDGISSGTYNYTKTAPDKGTLRVNVSAVDGENNEHSQVTYQLTFTSDNAGTCTFSGTYAGSDEEDGPYTGTVTDGKGTFSFVPIARTVTEWREKYFGDPDGTGDAANDVDFDGDGVPNLLEYALGTSPVDGTSFRSIAPTIITSDDQNYLSLCIDKPVGVSGINYTVEVTSNLDGVWSGATTEVANTSTKLIVRDSTPVSPSQPKRFIRLRVAESR